jgi:hypothetical protein
LANTAGTGAALYATSGVTTTINGVSTASQLIVDATIR